MIPFEKKNLNFNYCNQQTFTLIPENTLGCLYFSLVYPYAIYSIEVWGKSNLTKLGILRRLLDKYSKILSNLRFGNQYIKFCPLIFDKVCDHFYLIRFYTCFAPVLVRTLKKNSLSIRQHITLLLDLLKFKIW